MCNNIRDELQNQLRDRRNNFSTFIIALIQYNLELGNEEIREFLRIISTDDGALNLGLLHQWSQQTMDLTTIRFAHWVTDPEDFYEWMIVNPVFVDMAIQIDTNGFN